MSLQDIVVWTVSGLGLLVTFGISYWATLKFRDRILIQIAFCFVAVIVGNLAYVLTWPLFSGGLYMLHFIDQAFYPRAVEIGHATGVNGWRELARTIVCAAAGFIIAARRSKPDPAK